MARKRKRRNLRSLLQRFKKLAASQRLQIPSSVTSGLSGLASGVATVGATVGSVHTLATGFAQLAKQIGKVKDAWQDWRGLQASPGTSSTALVPQPPRSALSTAVLPSPLPLRTRGRGKKQPPSLSPGRATENLFAALGPFHEVFGGVATVMRDIRHVQEAWADLWKSLQKPAVATKAQTSAKRLTWRQRLPLLGNRAKALALPVPARAALSAPVVRVNPTPLPRLPFDPVLASLAMTALQPQMLGAAPSRALVPMQPGMSSSARPMLTQQGIPAVGTASGGMGNSTQAQAMQYLQMVVTVLQAIQRALEAQDEVAEGGANSTAERLHDPQQQEMSQARQVVHSAASAGGSHGNAPVQGNPKGPGIGQMIKALLSEDAIGAALEML